MYKTKRALVARHQNSFLTVLGYIQVEKYNVIVFTAKRPVHVLWVKPWETAPAKRGKESDGQPEETKAAFIAWGGHVAAVVTGKTAANVVPMRRA